MLTEHQMLPRSPLQTSQDHFKESQRHKMGQVGREHSGSPGPTSLLREGDPRARGTAHLSAPFTSSCLLFFSVYFLPAFTSRIHIRYLERKKAIVQAHTLTFHSYGNFRFLHIFFHLQKYIQISLMSFTQNRHKG